jgi:hypothetical protein
MKSPFILIVLLLTVSLLRAQPLMPVPEPQKPQAELPVRLDSAAPLDSLEKQLVNASFEQRGDLATAYDVANRSLDARVAELKARGLILSPEAAANLESARDYGRQAFRDLSLTTEETWRGGRHVGVMALRKVQDALEALQRTAVPVQ